MSDAPILTGELGLIGLFDLGQLFMLNRASGELVVTREGRKGYFYFDRGQIVNAVDDAYHEGEGAAYRLFTWKQGRFEFIAAPASGARAITESTEGLMMEAARRMDEEGGGSEGGEASKLAARANSLEALREAFHSVASSTRGLAADGDEGGASPFTLLRDPDDALLLRPGEPARVRAGGRWRDVGGALEPGAYDSLRGHLLDGAPPAAEGEHVSTRSVTDEAGCSLAVTRVAGAHEALWVRIADAPPADIEPVQAAPGAWDAVLGAAGGVLLVSAPDPEGADRAFHACVAQVARRRAGTLLLVARHERWRHADAAGALVRAGRADAAALLAALAPDVAAFDLAHADASAAARRSAARVIAAVVAPSPEAAAARWRAVTGADTEDSAIDVVHALARGADGRVTATVAPCTAPAASAPLPAPAPAPKSRKARPEPEPEPAPPPAADATPSAADPMAALAAELKRTLRKAA